MRRFDEPTVACLTGSTCRDLLRIKGGIMTGKRVRLIFVIIGLSLFFEGQVLAQDEANAAAQANKPLTNMTACNMQSLN